MDLYGSDTLPFLRCSKIEPNRLQPLKVDPARAMRHLDRRHYLRHEYAKEKAEAVEARRLAQIELDDVADRDQRRIDK